MSSTCAAHAVAQLLDRARREADLHQLVARSACCSLEVRSATCGLPSSSAFEHLLVRRADRVEAARARRPSARSRFCASAPCAAVGRRRRPRRRRRRRRLPRRRSRRLRRSESSRPSTTSSILQLVLARSCRRGRGSRATVIGQARDRLDHVLQAVLDALGDLDLAFAREQLDRAHLAHVHAHRVGGAAEFASRRVDSAASASSSTSSSGDRRPALRTSAASRRRAPAS